jgi:hypothetical protein
MMIVKDQVRQTVLRCRSFLAAKQPANARPPLPAAVVRRGYEADEDWGR